MTFRVLPCAGETIFIARENDPRYVPRVALERFEVVGYGTFVIHEPWMAEAPGMPTFVATEESTGLAVAKVWSPTREAARDTVLYALESVGKKRFRDAVRKARKAPKAKPTPA